MVKYCVPKGRPHDLEHAFEFRITRIEVSPAGGGFVKELTAKEFDEQFEPLTDEERWESPWKYTMFACDESPSIPGYTDGRRWNGWAVPRVELEALRQFIPRWKEWCQFDDDPLQYGMTWWEVDDEGKVWTCQNIETDGDRRTGEDRAIITQRDECHGRLIEIEPGRTAVVYDISDGLCWDQEEWIDE